MNDIEKAIAYLEDAVKETDEIIVDCSQRLQAELREQKEYFIIAVLALHEKTERENPKPLALDELKERVGKPVYRRWKNGNGTWEIVKQVTEETLPLGSRGKTIAKIHFNGAYSPEYFKSADFYDHEPKEVRQDA